MKTVKLLLFILLSIFSLTQNCKDNFDNKIRTITVEESINQLDNFDNAIYTIAIEEYVNQLDKFYTTNFYSQNKKKIIFIEEKDYLKDIPNNINGYKIVKINNKNKKKIVLKNKSILLVKVFELNEKNGKYYINITPYLTNFKKNNFNQMVSDWTIVYFENLDGNLFYSKTINNGI